MIVIIVIIIDLHTLYGNQGTRIIKVLEIMSFLHAEQTRRDIITIIIKIRVGGPRGGADGFSGFVR